MKALRIAPTISILLVASYCMTSCSPVLYTTVGQNVPMFHKKGEAVLDIGHAETNHAAGFSGQFAVATGASTLVMSSVYSLQHTNGNGSYFELGMGKFHHNEETNFIAELTGGLGWGSIHTTPDNKGRVDVSYLKPFLQPSIGFSGKIVEIAFTPRIGYVSYSSHSDNIVDVQLRRDLDLYYSSSNSFVVFEPGVTVRVGYKNVKLQGQYNRTSFDYSSPTGFQPVDKEFISVGLHILITDRWLKKE